MKRVSIWSLVAALIAVVAMQFGDVSDAQAARRHHMSFSHGSRSRPVSHGRSHRRAAGGGRHRARRATHSAPRRSRGGADEGGGAAAPGGGFKLENGVLTYPAPARFQPKNLKQQ